MPWHDMVWYGMTLTWPRMIPIIVSLSHSHTLLYCCFVQFRISYKDWIDHDIRQILIEVHGTPPKRTLPFFDSFPQHNYVMFSKEPNSFTGGRRIEFSYLKLQPSFFGR
jgi:hypothetical protein